MPQASSFDSLLEQCRDLVCERVAEALSKMLNEADAALTALETQARDAETKKLYQVTRNKVLSQRDTIVTQFRMRFLREFQERGNKVKKIGDQFAEIDLSSLELELVAEDDLDESLKFNAMAAKVRQYCDEELLALDQRVGVLIGDADLQPEDNPFTPQAICDAYKKTCRQVDSNVDVRVVLLKLFDDHVLDEIRAVYKAVNGLLIENSILPKIRFSVARGKENAKAPSSGAQGEQSAGDVAQTPEQGPGGEQDLFAQLQTLLAGNLQALAQQAGATAAGASPDLLGSLTRIQLGDASGITGGALPPAMVAGAPVTTNILQELKNTNVGSSMNQMDAMTLDIMAMLFDELFDDPKIPSSVKGLIGRLQIPMLKVAIADKSFFSRKNHPARQMLDKLGELSAGLPADINESDPIYGKLESILQELIDGFEDDIKIFDGLHERLDALIAEASERVEEKTQSIAKQVEQEESLALAKTVAQAEIKVRVRASAAPAPIIEFLAQQWVKLLIVIHVREGETSEAWKDALETADVLLWSGEPKATTEDRQNLAGVLPGLVKRIAVGLTYAGIDDTVRARFLSDLRKLHAEILDSSAESSSEASAEKSAVDHKSDEAGADIQSTDPEAGEQSEAPGITDDSEQSMVVIDLKDRVLADDSADAEPDEPKPIAKADEAETSVEFIELDSLAMPESNDGDDNTQEPGVVATPVEGGSTAIAEEGEAAEPSLTATAEKPEQSEPSLPPLEFEASPEVPAQQEPAVELPSEPDSVAPALEFEATLEAPAEQDAAPADESPTDSPALTLEPEAAPAEAAPTKATSTEDAQGLRLDSDVSPSAPAPNEAVPSEAATTEAATSAASTEEASKEDEAADEPGLLTMAFAAADVKAALASADDTAAEKEDSEDKAAEDEAADEPGLLTMAFAAADVKAALASADDTATEKEDSEDKAAEDEAADDEASEDPGLLTMQFAAAAAKAKAEAPPTEAATTDAPKEAAAKEDQATEDPGLLTMDFTRASANKASAKAAQTVPVSTDKASAANTTPTPTKATPSVSPSVKKPASPHAARAQAAATQPKTVSPASSPAVPGQPAKPTIAKPPPPSTSAAQPVAASAASPAAPAQSAGASQAGVDLNAPVVLKNPFGDGEVQVSDLDFTDVFKDKKGKPDAENAKSAKSQADYAFIPKGLVEGSWVEIREKSGSDKGIRAKLSIVSPLKARFVFATRQGKTVLDCSRAELARRFKAGEMVLSIEEPAASLFDRLAGGLVGKLGGGKKS